ncbi:MAG TPA: hypothetical protein VE779_03420 [Candidatus Angelobacter sp.]|nr:hypothetical protein [Candidatus Angelobacter sp.]
MGTIGEWLSVLVWGGLYGGTMAWWTARDRGSSVFKQTDRVEHLVSWAFGGLLFGIMTTFSWHRAIHRPLIFVTVSAFAGIFLTGWFFRRGRTTR